MVKVELSIEINEKEDKGNLKLAMDLLKREDWNEQEWGLANILQDSLEGILDLVKKTGMATETFRKIIKDDN